MDHSLGTLLTQKNDEGAKQAIYYLSRTLIRAESRYNPVEKECLALVFVIQIMRNYLVGQSIHVISRINPLWILMTKPSSLNSKLVNWAILMSQYDLTFVPQKAIKRQALADFLVDHPASKSSKLHEDILDEVIKANMTSIDDVWQMFFDGASRTGSKGKIVAGVGGDICLTWEYVLPRAFLLIEPCSKNVAEDNALLIGLQLTQQMRVRYLEAYGDSKLIVNQVKGEYEVRHEDLIAYHHAATKLANLFDGFYISYVSRLLNIKADALAMLTATLALPADTTYHLTVTTRHLFCPKYSLEVSEVHTPR